MTHRELIRNDCLDVFREGDIDAGSVDLIYLDPPFNSNQTYNLPFKKLLEKYGKDIAAVEAFKDMWHWDEQTQDFYEQLRDTTRAGIAIRGLIDHIIGLRGGKEKMTAYLVNMAIRLIKMRRVLKPTGSIYLHCDPTASHYLKVIMDAIFGKKNFISEVIWNYGTPSGGRTLGKKPVKAHDTLLSYAHTYGQHTYNIQYLPYNKKYIKEWFRHTDEDGRHYRTRSREKKIIRQYLDESPGVPLSNVWSDIMQLYGSAGWFKKLGTDERVGYPTQKPLALLERIIKASSNKGGLVLDPFCGCGTTVHAAENLERQWIGIDISRFAIGLMKNRLRDSEHKDILGEIQTSGLPTTAEEARELAKKDPFEFEKWVCGHIGASGLYKNPGEKGRDAGIDGVVEFYMDKNEVSYAIVQVKGGTVKPNDVKALFSDVEEEPNAQAGIFICFEEYRTTVENNQSHKKFKDKIAQNEWPVIQLITIEEMFEGKEINLPNVSVKRRGHKVKRQKAMPV